MFGHNEQRLDNIYKAINKDNNYHYSCDRIVPHKCPVCGGRGTVPRDFYGYIDSTSAVNQQDTCRACYGKGFIWRQS